MQMFMPCRMNREATDHGLLFSPTGTTQGCDKLGLCFWRLTGIGWHLPGKHKCAWVVASNADEVLSPQTVKVQIKARQVTVEGPRGKLVKDLSHIAVSFSTPKKNVIAIHIHHGVRKNVAALRTVRTIINNLIVGVTKGFKYKMRYVYAHFPINVNLDKNSDGVYEVEIRYVENQTPVGWPEGGRAMKHHRRCGIPWEQGC